MELIEHKYVEANGLKHHVAEIGSGSTVVLFLHGFPEIWYTWRYQMVAVAKAGYRAIAPDFRGYGLSDKPPVPEDTSFSVLVDDLPPILDAMKVDKVYVLIIYYIIGARLNTNHISLQRVICVTKTSDL